MIYRRCGYHLLIVGATQLYTQRLRQRRGPPTGRDSRRRARCPRPWGRTRAPKA